ncbi:MAG: hypothetical protein EOM23_05675 [Candidatus Moranbacteria bacterium]|nr:hypothetical protein [Candidatus Moranbacteria bacterium]
MIQKLVEKLNLKVTYLEREYIPITKKLRAKGAFRWNYLDHQGEILLAKSATDRTKLHEIGHAINFILGRGNPISDTLGIESEEFANHMADILELCYSKNAKED